jgi:hypothetical protein
MRFRGRIRWAGHIEYIYEREIRDEVGSRASELKCTWKAKCGMGAETGCCNLSNDCTGLRQEVCAYCFMGEDVFGISVWREPVNGGGIPSTGPSAAGLPTAPLAYVLHYFKSLSLTFRQIIVVDEKSCSFSHIFQFYVFF